MRAPIHSKEREGPQDLQELVVSGRLLLGYPHGWAGEVVTQILEACRALESDLDVDSGGLQWAPVCHDWWEGTRKSEWCPWHVFELYRTLMRDVTLSYPGRNAGCGAVKPIEFVGDYLITETNHDLLPALSALVPPAVTSSRKYRRRRKAMHSLRWSANRNFEAAPRSSRKSLRQSTDIPRSLSRISRATGRSFLSSGQGMSSWPSDLAIVVIS